MRHEMEIVTKGVEQSRAVEPTTGRLPVPCPRIPITVRAGTMEDLAFIDGLQKKHTKQVGFMHTAALEGKIRLGHVIVAWAPRPRLSENVGEAPTPQEEERVGYLIGNDQYFKRDDVGAIFQINIVEGKRRALVGATLLKAQFDRSAYGCKLYCCWCAQDLPANYFWQSMGFVPLAFRTGSEKKDRVHIFWQKRIRSGDETTAWWFPSQTTGGSIRADRLVFPIPPGKHWSEEMPRILPSEESTKLHDPHAGSPNPKQGPSNKSKAQNKGVLPPTRRFVQFGRASLNLVAAPEPVAPVEKQKAPRKPKVKNDPKLVAAARELRDRWLEHVNRNPAALVSEGKYQVSRMLAAPEPHEPARSPQLMAA
jgi:hypothetical protein